MEFTLPKEIRHDEDGFKNLVDFYEQTKCCFAERVEVDMRSTFWFDADMCAVFGALLCRLKDNLNLVHFRNLSPEIESILSKNGFLSHYGKQKIPDSYKTTILYKRFNVKDERYFSDYVEQEFIHRPEIPEMTPKLLKKMCGSVYEIFNNAVHHSQTELGIFSCGQFFPKKDRLDFTIADLGVGIKANVCRYLQKNVSAVDAIEWAVRDKHTTKRNVSGGLGLALLSEFIDLNQGCIRIVSDAAYWRRQNRRNYKVQLARAFPGTVVNIEINTADTGSYGLYSESDDGSIF